MGFFERNKKEKQPLALEPGKEDMEILESSDTRKAQGENPHRVVWFRDMRDGFFKVGFLYQQDGGAEHFDTLNHPIRSFESEKEAVAYFNEACVLSGKMVRNNPDSTWYHDRIPFKELDNTEKE